MTDLVHIGRLRARYRVAGDADGARARLDAVLSRMLDATLEAAVRRLDLPEGEEICVRAVRAPATLSLDASDAAVAEAWSEALARALEEAIASGRDVIRFRSRRHALLDLVASAARGEVSRRWAWAQLGLWSAPIDVVQVPAVPGTAEVGEVIARALSAMPEAAPAAVAEAARRGAFAALVARLPPAAWRRVAALALGAFGAATAAVEALEPPSPGKAKAVPAAPDPDSATRASRIAARSPVVALLRRHGSGAAPEARRALLALAALEAEPEALRLPRAGAVLATLELAVRAATRPDPEDARPSPAVPRSGTESPLVPAPALAAPRGPVDAADAADAAGRADGPDGALGERTPAGEAESPRAPVEPRAVGRTRAGGLLFLLHLVGERGLPETLCDEAGPLARRSLRFGLHALASALLPIEPHDPAALAFCGLGPEDPPPCQGEDPLTDPERDALGATATALSEELRTRLGRLDEPIRAVLLETCRRDAEVVADPAWLEVRYALDDVDVRVRRAGLDLDPGWLPWLGCVVRFVHA